MKNHLSQLNLKPLKYSPLGTISQFKIIHDFFTDWAVFLLISGEMRYSVESSGEHILHAGELLICPPFFNVRKVLTKPSEVVYLSFGCADPAQRMAMGSLVMPINPRIAEDLQLLAGCDRDDGYISVLQMDIWHQLCTMYTDPVIPDATPVAADDFSRLLAYIDTNFCSGLTINMLADIYGASVSTLTQHFRQRTGSTPMQYIAEKRMTLAMKLLGSTRRTVRDIAAACGYANEFYFSNAFRRRTGLCPSEYRRKYI